MAILPWGKKKDLITKAQAFVDRCTTEYKLGTKQLGKCAKDWIIRQDWTGREDDFKRVLLYATLTAQADEIRAGHFPLRKRSDHEAYANLQFESMALEDIVVSKLDHFFTKLGKTEIEGLYDTVVRQVEKGLISTTLKYTNGNKVIASRLLGISRNTLARKAKELKIG